MISVCCIFYYALSLERAILLSQNFWSLREVCVQYLNSDQNVSRRQVIVTYEFRLNDGEFKKLVSIKVVMHFLKYFFGDHYTFSLQT